MIDTSSLSYKYSARNLASLPIFHEQLPEKLPHWQATSSNLIRHHPSLPTYSSSLSLKERVIQTLDQVADHPGETLRRWLPVMTQCTLVGCVIGATVGVSVGIPAGLAAWKASIMAAHPVLAWTSSWFH